MLFVEDLPEENGIWPSPDFVGYVIGEIVLECNCPAANQSATVAYSFERIPGSHPGSHTGSHWDTL